MSREGNLKDITGAEVVEIAIREDGKVIWVNTEQGCVLRICKIKGKLTVDDRRNVLTKGSFSGIKVVCSLLDIKAFYSRTAYYVAIAM